MPRTIHDHEKARYDHRIATFDHPITTRDHVVATFLPSPSQRGGVGGGASRGPWGGASCACPCRRTHDVLPLTARLRQRRGCSMATAMVETGQLTGRELMAHLFRRAGFGATPGGARGRPGPGLRGDRREAAPPGAAARARRRPDLPLLRRLPRVAQDRLGDVALGLPDDQHPAAARREDDPLLALPVRDRQLQGRSRRRRCSSRSTPSGGTRSATSATSWSTSRRRTRR